MTPVRPNHDEQKIAAKCSINRFDLRIVCCLHRLNLVAIAINTMSKQLKLDLQRDQQKVRRYFERRIRDYSVHINLGPGEDEDPISLITIGFYASQGGYVSLIFDTRPNAGPHNGFDGEWTQYLDHVRIFFG